MRVVVLGAGVVGVTTAYALASRGCDVTVMERRSELAGEASFANGGQLSYDFASPTGSPGVLRHLADYLLGKDEAFKIGLSFDPAFLNWGARFLVNCTPGPARQNAEALARLAQRSDGAFKRVIRQAGVQFAHRKAGKLVLFNSEDDFKRAATRAEQAYKKGRALRPLDTSACLALEPALNCWRGSAIAGGLYAPNDDVGDARTFALSLGAAARDQFGVDFLLNTSVRAILARNNQVYGVAADDGDVAADAVVVCMGVNAPRLLRPLGVAAPVQPIRGYSITAPAAEGAPSIAITDLARKMVYSRIGENLRVAGFADAGAQRTDVAQRRTDLLLRRATEAFPGAADFSNVSSRWVGVRPSTPNSLPIVGETKVNRLFLNIGHGMFGWTLSAVCAEKIANDVILGERDSLLDRKAA